MSLSFWGTTLVRECNRQIDDDEETKSLVRAANLSAWVLNLLKEAGLTSDIIDAALFAETTFPDQDEQKKQYYDISAYILRRDRATIYKTICGLSTENIDYLLGHYNKTAKRRKADLRLTE